MYRTPSCGFGGLLICFVVCGNVRNGTGQGVLNIYLILYEIIVDAFLEQIFFNFSLFFGFFFLSPLPFFHFTSSTSLFYLTSSNSTPRATGVPFRFYAAPDNLAEGGMKGH